MVKKSELIFGSRAVDEALRAGCSLEKIVVQRGSEKPFIKGLMAKARALCIPVSFAPRQKLDRLTVKNHQGVVAIRSAVRYAILENVIDHSYQEGKYPFFLLLDHVTNVGNFGAVARTAECAGVQAVVVEDKGRVLLAGDAVRASAGALNHIPICRTQDLKKTIRTLQQNGLKVVACTEKANTLLYDINMQGPLALLLGSEEKGIASSLCSEADESARIPMYGNMQSLNVSVAAAIATYEAVRQRSRLTSAPDRDKTIEKF